MGPTIFYKYIAPFIYMYLNVMETEGGYGKGGDEQREKGEGRPQGGHGPDDRVRVHNVLGAIVYI